MKHLTRYFSEVYKQNITTMPKNNLGIVVVIPCHNEPKLQDTLKVLAECTPIDVGIEIIVVVNYGADTTASIKDQCRLNFSETIHLAKELNRDGFEITAILLENIPIKQAGVGFARKTGMDEAAYRFMRLHKPEGIILCFDADSICSLNYFKSIQEHFSFYPDTQAASLYYEHPIVGNEFPETIYEGIAQYELHLRYYNQAQKWAQLPYAYHTVGSSMLCTASAYAKVGGMNKRKAGEDFYFLQKLIPIVPFYEINTLKVIPSPRTSDRVPFGTGRAMMKLESENFSMLQTYNLEAFKQIKNLIEVLESLYQAKKSDVEKQLSKLDKVFTLYLLKHNILEKIAEINKNSTSYLSFRKRFFVWFDAFFVLKFMNYVHEEAYSKKGVLDAANELLHLLGLAEEENTKEALTRYREIEGRK